MALHPCCRARALTAVLAVCCGTPRAAWATERSDATENLEPPADLAAPVPVSAALAEAPIVAYAYAAAGVSAGEIGASAYGLGLVPGSDQRATLGGGVTAWGSPVSRLTLIGDAARDAFGSFAPSAAALVRLAGARPREEGWSLGALGKFKVDGFGVGAEHEMESEIEAGLLVTNRRGGWTFDVDAIAGAGLGDEGEMDGEARLRVGRALGAHVRIGIDGQVRARLAGSRRLYGDRSWDVAGGPQLVLGTSRLFGSFTSGPSTMGVWRGVGWGAVASLGVTTF